jgi:hypothetical protein
VKNPSSEAKPLIGPLRLLLTNDVMKRNYTLRIFFKIQKLKTANISDSEAFLH